MLVCAQGTIVRTRDSSMLSLQTIAISIAMSSLWAAYGAILGDACIVVPNVIGALLGGVQLAVQQRYSRRRMRTGHVIIKAHESLADLAVF